MQASTQSRIKGTIWGQVLWNRHVHKPATGQMNLPELYRQRLPKCLHAHRSEANLVAAHLPNNTNTATPGKTKQLHKPVMASFSFWQRKFDTATVTCHLPTCDHQPIVLKSIRPTLRPSISGSSWAVDALLHRFFFKYWNIPKKHDFEGWLEMRWEHHLHLLRNLESLRFFCTILPHVEIHKRDYPQGPVLVRTSPCHPEASHSNTSSVLQTVN